MAMLDDLDQFVQARVTRRRSPTQQWFDAHPDVAERVLRGYYEQGYQIMPMFEWAVKAHNFERRYSSFETWLHANKPT
jgi:hypothetical protein